MNFCKFSAAIVAIGILSACSSESNNSENDLDEFISKAEAFDDAQPANVDDLSGSANMTGYFGVIEDGSNTRAAYFGDANVIADFEAETLTGTADNFAEYEVSGACVDGPTDCTGTELQNIDGSLDITGVIDGVDFDFIAEGELSGFEDDNIASTEIELLDGFGNFKTVGGNLVAGGGGEGLAASTLTGGGDEVVDIIGIFLVEE